MGKLIDVKVGTTVTAGAYSAGNAVGGKLTFTGLVDGGQSKLLQVIIHDKANQKSAVDLLLFNQDFTATTDKTASAISAADMANCIGVISVAAADYSSLAASTNAVATKLLAQGLGLCAAGDNNLYGQLVSRGTPTYTSTSDIAVRLVAEQVKG